MDYRRERAIAWDALTIYAVTVDHGDRLVLHVYSKSSSPGVH